MKYLALIIVALCFSASLSNAQIVSKLIEYRPAPGQLVNTEAAGSYSAAESLVGSLNGMVSLGAFGGYVVYAFGAPVKNDAKNPYGVDFVIVGNVQTDWAEPGIVSVMKDENKNGKPDDIWYELAGSEYFFSTTQKNISVTYANPLFSGSDDVFWQHSDGTSGVVATNEFHKQDYFPSAEFFGENAVSSMMVSGTLIADQVDLSNPAMVKCYYRRFGYADNTLRTNSTAILPDNPYSELIEGYGGDAMDISWAVDNNGNYVEIDQINFVKIQTGVLANAGWCGEISTEITGIFDVVPDETLAQIPACVVINRIAQKIILGSKLQLEAAAFVNGRFDANERITWKTDNNTLASVSADGMINALGQGKVSVIASLSDRPGVESSLSFEIVAPQRIEVLLTSSVILVNEETEIKIKVFDNAGKEITGLKTGFSFSVNSAFSIAERAGKFYIKGLKEGESTLDVFLVQAPDIKETVNVSVVEKVEQKQVYLTIKNENSTLEPRKLQTVSLFNLNSYVDNGSGIYNIDQLEGITVAHVFAAWFKENGMESDFRFRDDEKSGGNLYAWKVPYGDSLNVELIYGYGGNTQSTSFAKSWIVLLNNQHIIHGLDKYFVKNGDEIVLYHVDNILEEWKLSYLQSDKHVVNCNETFEVFLTELTCALTAGGQIEVRNSIPIQNEAVRINGVQAYVDGKILQTNSLGSVELSFSEPGDKTISIGVDELTVHVTDPLSATTFSRQNAPKTWPLPCNSLLNIEFNEPQSCTISLYDLAGRRLLSRKSPENANHQIPIDQFIPGVYILTVEANNHIFNKKIIIE